MNKVEKMTVDEIAIQLLKENKLVLTDKEKKYRKNVQKLFMLKKGARIDKQEFMNFKDLKTLRKTEKQDLEAKEKDLRADGMIVIDKRGKSHVLRQDIKYSERDLVSKKVNSHIVERMKQFADRRGLGDEGERIRVHNGEIDGKKLRKLHAKDPKRQKIGQL